MSNYILICNNYVVVARGRARIIQMYENTATAVIEYGGYEYYRYRLTGGAVP